MKQKSAAHSFKVKQALLYNLGIKAKREIIPEKRKEAHRKR